jgi:hypothetical protein
VYALWIEGGKQTRYNWRWMKGLLPVSIHCDSQENTFPNIRENSVLLKRVIWVVSSVGAGSMVHVSADANQNEEMGSNRKVTSKASEGDCVTRSVLSGVSSVCSGTNDVGLEGGYMQVRPRDTHRVHCGRCFPHLRRAWAHRLHAVDSIMGFI